MKQLFEKIRRALAAAWAYVRTLGVLRITISPEEPAPARKALPATTGIEDDDHGDDDDAPPSGGLARVVPTA